MSMFAHLSLLEEPLRSLTPVLLEIDFRHHSNLFSHERDDATAYLVLPLGEASIELEGFQQYGKVEPGGSAFVAERIAFVRGQRPMLDQFSRAPILHMEDIMTRPMQEPVSPLPISNRIELLDVLRGFALMGMVVVHIVG